MEQRDLGMYRVDEIRDNIDAAIELTMLDAEEKDWDILQDVRVRLYEMFGIVE